MVLGTLSAGQLITMQVKLVIFHTKSHNLTVRTVNQSGDKEMNKAPAPPPPERETECATDDSAVVTGDVETYCTSYM